MHHMQRWLALFMVSECVELHKDLKAQRRREIKRARVTKDEGLVYYSSQRSMQNAFLE